MQSAPTSRFTAPGRKARFDKTFLHDVWHLTKPYFVHSEERRSARWLLVVIMLFTLAQVYVGLRITNWYNTFWDAMQQYDKQAFWHLLGVFTLLALTSIVLSVYQTYVTQMLDLRWRRWLTQSYLTRYLHGRAYYHLEVFKRGQDNPDQRIADDDAIRHALTSVGMGDLGELLDEVQPWSHMLSLGEQQRLAMARVLLTRPRWLFMDEASSALDEPTEERLYRLIIENLPGITLVSVGHRSTLQAHHTRRLQLLDDGAWRWQALMPNPPLSAASDSAMAAS